MVGRSSRDWGGGLTGRLHPEIWSEDELDNLLQEVLKLIRPPGDDALIDNPEDSSYDRLLQCRRQALALIGEPAPDAEEGNHGPDRPLVALGSGGTGRKRLNDENAGERRLAGDEGEQGTET